MTHDPPLQAHQGNKECKALPSDPLHPSLTPLNKEKTELQIPVIIPARSIRRPAVFLSIAGLSDDAFPVFHAIALEVTPGTVLSEVLPFHLLVSHFCDVWRELGGLNEGREQCTSVPCEVWQLREVWRSPWPSARPIRLV